MRVKTNLLQFFSLITYHKVETAEGHTALLRAVKNRLLPMVNPSFLLINKPFFVFIRGILQYYPMWGYFSEEPSSPNGKPFFSFMISFNIIQCGIFQYYQMRGYPNLVPTVVILPLFQVMLLVEAGADAGAIDEDGNNSLHIATRYTA